MKQHFQPHVPVRTVAMLSLEEEAIAMTEIADSSGAIDADLVAVDRATDVAKGVEDVEVIMGNINNVDDTCAALIAAVGEMGVVGTDADPEEIMPDNVTPEVLEVATEGALVAGGGGAPQAKPKVDTGPGMAAKMKETLKKIWNGIMELLKSAWENIKKFFGGIFDYLQNSKAQIKDLQEKLKNVSKLKAGAEKRPVVVADPYEFIIGFLSNPTQRIAASEKYMQSVFTDGARSVAKIGNTLTMSLKSFSPQGAADWEAKTVKAVATEVQQLAAILAAKEFGESPKNSFDNKKALIAGKNVLGNWNISTFGEEVAFTGQGPEQTEALAKIRFRAHNGYTSETNGIQFPKPFDPGMLSSMLRDAEKMIDHLFYLQRGDGARLLKDGITNIHRAGEEAANKLATAQTDSGNVVGEDDNYAKAILQRVMRLSSAYGNWTNAPLKDAAQRSAMFVNMNLNIVRKMLHYYE